MPTRGNPGDLHVFSLRSIPHPRAHRRRQFPTPYLLIDLIYAFWGYINTIAKRDVFWTFSRVYWENVNNTFDRTLYKNTWPNLCLLYIALYPISSIFLSCISFKLDWRNISLFLLQKKKAFKYAPFAGIFAWNPLKHTSKYRLSFW